jgi:hypothetical protein
MSMRSPCPIDGHRGHPSLEEGVPDLPRLEGAPHWIRCRHRVHDGEAHGGAAVGQRTELEEVA